MRGRGLLFSIVIALSGCTAEATTDDDEDIRSSTSSILPRHESFVSALRARAEQTKQTAVLKEHKAQLVDAASECIEEDGWIVPTNTSTELSTRDSFWLMAAFNSPERSAFVIDTISKNLRNGEAPTRVMRDGKADYGDDESTLLFVLHNLHLSMLGKPVNKTKLTEVYNYLANHSPEGVWRTNGKGTAYEQGLLALAVRALEKMAVRDERDLGRKATLAYQTMTKTNASALVPEALAFIFFEEPLLKDVDMNAPKGEYLNDVLALYATARHGNEKASDALLARFATEAKVKAVPPAKNAFVIRLL